MASGSFLGGQEAQAELVEIVEVESLHWVECGEVSVRLTVVIMLSKLITKWLGVQQWGLQRHAPVVGQGLLNDFLKGARFLEDGIKEGRKEQRKEAVS